MLDVLGQDPRQVPALSKGPRVPPGFRCVPRAQSLQLCPTFFDAMDHNLPGSSVLGILQARILEWVAQLSSKKSNEETSSPCFYFLESLVSFLFQYFSYKNTDK